MFYYTYSITKASNPLNMLLALQMTFIVGCMIKTKVKFLETTEATSFINNY
tara:strand:+ start:344 stop:496 length:153 start_codon:yes stop_codon:yes gene_type:complete